MTFTYSLGNDVGRVRFELSDVVSGSALFSDEEITYQLGESGTVLDAAADLADILATRFAGDYDFGTDGQYFKRSQQAAAWAARAAALRARANGGNTLAVQGMTHVDSFSKRAARVRELGDCCPSDFDVPC